MRLPGAGWTQWPWAQQRRADPVRCVGDSVVDWRVTERRGSAHGRRRASRSVPSGSVDELDERPRLPLGETGELASARLDHGRPRGHVLRARMQVAQEPLQRARAQR